MHWCLSWRCKAVEHHTWCLWDRSTNDDVLSRPLWWVSAWKMLSPEPRTDNQDAQKPRTVVFPRSYEIFSNHSHPLLHPPLKVDWNFQRVLSFCLVAQVLQVFPSQWCAHHLDEQSLRPLWFPSLFSNSQTCREDQKGIFFQLPSFFRLKFLKKRKCCTLISNHQQIVNMDGDIQPAALLMWLPVLSRQSGLHDITFQTMFLTLLFELIKPSTCCCSLPWQNTTQTMQLLMFFHKSFLSLWLPHHQKRICHIYCPEVQIDIHQKKSKNDEAWGARWRTQMLVQKPYLERLATCTAVSQALHDETNLLSLGGVSMSPLLWLWWCRIPHPILHSPQQGWAPPSWSAFLPQMSSVSAFRSMSDSIFGGWSSSSFTKSSHSKKNSSSVAISTSSSPSGNSTNTLLIFSSSLQPRHGPFSAS